MERNGKTETMERNGKTEMRAVQARNGNGNEKLTEVKESASDGQAETVATCFESFDDMQLAEVSSE